MFTTAVLSIESANYEKRDAVIREFIRYTEFLSDYESKIEETSLHSISMIELSRSGKILNKIPPKTMIQVKDIKDILQRAFSGRIAYRLENSYLYVAVPTKRGAMLARKHINFNAGQYHTLLYLTFILFISLLLYLYYTDKERSKELQQQINEAQSKEKKSRLKLYRFYIMLSALLNRAGFMLLMVLPNGKITYSSKAAKELFHAEQGYFFWEKLRNIELKNAIKEAIESHQEVKSKTQLLGRKYEITCFPSSRHKKDPIIVNVTDITEKAELTRSKSELIADIAHELKTPLAVMKGYVEILRDTLPQESIGILEKLSNRVEQLNQIVESILTLYRIESKEEKKEIIYLPDIIKEVYSTYKGQAEGRGLKMELQVGDENYLYVESTPALLQIALSNILDNAIRYTESGKILIRVFQKDGYANIEIQDTGIGVPHEELSRIFNRFHVVPRSREKGLSGTGIGLSITKNIIQRHNGKIYAESKLGIGSKFTLLLPSVHLSKVAS